MTATFQTSAAATSHDAVADFFTRDIPEPYRILGLKLLPLSIGRYRRMARFNVSFVSETAGTATGADLLFGVLICSMKCRRPDFDHDESNIYWDELAISDQLKPTFDKWLRIIKAAPPFYLRGRFGRIISKTFIGRHWRKHHSFDLHQKCRLFAEYINEAQRIPRFLMKSGGHGVSNSHWSHNIEVVLMGELNWTHDDIEERPLSKALADYFKHLENQGLITILTEQDFQMIRANDAALEAMEAATKKEAAHVR